MKVSKILIKIGLILLILVTAVLAVRAVFNYTEGRKLARAVADLKDKGIPISAKDLGPPCPDRDNAARLWRAAENLLTIEGDDKGILSESWTDFLNGKPLNSAHREGLAKLIDKNELALRLVREIADKPCFLFRDRADSFAETIIPSAIKMTLATRLLGLQAMRMAESGSIQGALEMLRAGLKFTPRISEEGLLITFLIAVADTRMLLYSLAEVCHGRAVDEATLISLIDGLDPGSWRSRLARSISGERVSGLESGFDIIQGKASAMANEKGINRFFYWLARPILKSEIIWRLEQWSRWEQISREPYFHQRGILKTDGEYMGRIPWYFRLTGYQGGGVRHNFSETSRPRSDVPRRPDRPRLPALQEPERELSGEPRGPRPRYPERGPRRSVHGKGICLPPGGGGLHRLQPRFEREGRRRPVDLRGYPVGHGERRRLDMEGEPMKGQGIPYHAIDWGLVPRTEHKGETGTSFWRTQQFDGLRIRIVEYSKGYLADHWCQKGHVVHCLEGEFVNEQENGERTIMTKGMTYVVSDERSSHRSRTEHGAMLLIVDGDFLKLE